MNEWIKLIVTGTLGAVVNGIVTYVLVRRLIKGVEKLEDKIIKGAQNGKK